MNETSLMLRTVCWCCLAEDCYKDFVSEYLYCGEKEVYEEMIRNTFGVEIMQADLHYQEKQLICDECIIKLRDAWMFKSTVLKSLDTLKEIMFGNCDGTNPLDVELKVEEIKFESLPDDQYNDESFDDDDEILANLKQELTRAKEHTDCTVSKDLRRRKLGRVKNREIVADIDDEKIDCLTTSEKKWLKLSERRGNGPILRENSLKLLENSTICVFQWDKSRYRCFCCKEPFSDMNQLKEHTNAKHTLENIERKIISQQNRLVKVEITKILCKICSGEMKDLTSLREHLCQLHNVQFRLNDDLLVPFKIDSRLECQICSENFTMFRLLNIHMNKHYQKQVCHICGAGFSNLVFLNLHKSRNHRQLSCKPCGIAFIDKIEKRRHDVSVHGLKIERKPRFPCPYCSERFAQENFRVLHLVDKHGMKKPEYKCNVCCKAFVTRSLCNNHVKNVHMKEKNHECDICHNLFYTKSDVSRHRVTHTGEKRFSCSLCNNPFATKDSLRRHMKRSHVGV